MIVDVEATPARTYDEVAATKTMIERTAKRLGLKPKRLAADTAYGTGKFLGWLIGARIAPHIPVWDRSSEKMAHWRARIFTGTDDGAFTFARTARCCTPPAQCTRATLRYRASKFDCEVCALKMQCCPNGPSRQIPRDVHEYAREVTRRLMRTKAFIKSRDQRKRVEMRFARFENSPRLRAHAAARTFRRTRRISSSPPSCKISRPWRSESSSHHPLSGAWLLLEIAHDRLSSVRVQVAANRAAEKPPKSIQPISQLLFQHYRPRATFCNTAKSGLFRPRKRPGYTANFRSLRADANPVPRNGTFCKSWDLS